MSFRATKLLLEQQETVRMTKDMGFFGTRVFTWRGPPYDIKKHPETPADVRRRSLALYHKILNKLPWMKETFGLPFSLETMAATVKDMFLRYRDVENTDIAAMLQFKGISDLEDFENQFKSEHHAYAYVREWEERELQRRQKAELLAAQEEANETTKMISMNKIEFLQYLHKTGVVPLEIKVWPQYVKWRDDQKEKFEHFAVETGLFTPEELQDNEVVAKKASCAIM